MTPSPYTEDTLVQQTTAEYLERELGWESLYAYNNEDFGPDSLLGRKSDREVVMWFNSNGHPIKSYEERNEVYHERKPQETKLHERI